MMTRGRRAKASQPVTPRFPVRFSHDPHLCEGEFNRIAAHRRTLANQLLGFSTLPGGKALQFALERSLGKRRATQVARATRIPQNSRPCDAALSLRPDLLQWLYRVFEEQGTHSRLPVGAA
jgi:hypothetical protein